LQGLFVGGAPASGGPVAAGRAWARRALPLVVLRIFAGLSMALAHGFGKLPPGSQFISGVESIGLPAPAFFAWAAAISEGVGGLCLAAGFLTRPSAFLLVVTMLVAAFGVHGGDPFGDKEMALLYAAAFLPFVFAGCGRVGIDQLFGSKG